MNDDFIRKPGDTRTGEQFLKDQRAVKEVTDKILSPMFKEAPPDDLQKLIAWRNSIRTKVYDQLNPIVAQAIMRSPSDPMYAHSATGRATLLVTAHKLYLDELRKLSKDEAIFLLAMMYAERTLEDLV